MSEKLKALYELQVIDLDLAKTRKTLANLDDGASKKQEVESAAGSVEAANALLHEATSEMQDKDLNLKTVETKQKTFKDKLYSGKVSNPKELESMEKEIEMLGRQKGKLEERILELMDIIEERRSALEAAQSDLKQQEDEYATLMRQRKEAQDMLGAQIYELTARREQAAANVDAVLLKRYEAVRSRGGGVVVSKVVDESCSACHTGLIGSVSRHLHAGSEDEICENCGRILYLER